MVSVPLYPYKAWLPAPIYWPFRALRTLLVALCFAGFWGGSFVLAWSWLPILSLWPGSRLEKMRRSHRSMRRGFRLFHFTMRMFRLYHRTSPITTLRQSGSPVVLVANHPTLCDVTSIISLFPDVVAIARPSFARNPLINRAVRMSGFVPAGMHVLKDCEERLRMGFDVLVFPEGTRSPASGTPHPFHRGAFELAARAKVPIVLLKLTCSPPVLSKRLPIWKYSDRRAVLTIEPFATIAPTDHKLDSRAMCRAVEQRYRDVLGYPGPGEAANQPQPLGDVQ